MTLAHSDIIANESHLDSVVPLDFRRRRGKMLDCWCGARFFSQIHLHAGMFGMKYKKESDAFPRAELLPRSRRLQFSLAGIFTLPAGFESYGGSPAVGGGRVAVLFHEDGSALDAVR